MCLNQKVLSIMVISFSIITLCLGIATICGYINIEIMMLFLGFTQVSSGLSQINLAKSINKDGVSKGNRTVGIVSLIIGVVIMTMYCIKILL